MGIIQGIAGGLFAKDVNIDTMVVRFDDDYVTPARYVPQLTLCSGVSASHAWVSVPLKNFGAGEYDRMFGEVALKKLGPIGQLKLRARGVVSYLDRRGVSVDLLAGSVVEAAHTLHNDSGLLQIWDDRWWLGQLTMMGCLVWDPQSKRSHWDFGRECIYNFQGMLDCIDSDLGPVHAPCPKCGYSETAFTQPEPGDRTRARPWRVIDIVRNMRLRFLAGNTSKTYLGNRFLPAFIEWPAALGSGLAGMDRTCHSLRFENQTLLQALQSIIRKAGPYDLYMSPLGDGSFRSVLRIVDMGQTRPTATLETGDVSGLGPEYALASKLVVSEGVMTESAKGYYDEIVRVGDPPVIEAMLSVPDEHGLAAEANVLEGLEYAFLDASAGETAAKYRQSAYFKDFLAFIVAHGDGEAGMKAAFLEFPLIGTSFRMSLGANGLIWAGSKYDGYANRGRMRFMSQNASGYNESAANPRDFFPREIVVENFFDYQHEAIPAPDPAHDPAFEWLGGLNVNIALSPDSTVLMFPGCNSIEMEGKTYYRIERAPMDPLVGSYSANFRLRPIRANVTMQADWPITGYGVGDPNGTAERVNGATLSSYVSKSAPGDQVELLRSKYAWPLGKAGWKDAVNVVDPRQLAERDTVGNELFSDVKLMRTFAAARLRDIRRVEKSGLLRIPALSPGMVPGTCVQILSKDGLPIITSMKSVTFSAIGHSLRNPDDQAPDTWIEFGPADMSVLMEMPNASPPPPSKSASTPETSTETSAGGIPGSISIANAGAGGAGGAGGGDAGYSGGGGGTPSQGGGGAVLQSATSPRGNIEGPQIGPRQAGQIGSGVGDRFQGPNRVEQVSPETAARRAAPRSINDGSARAGGRNTEPNNSRFGLGSQASNGSVGGKSDLSGGLLGTPGSGRMGNRTDLSGAFSADTSKSKASDDANYKGTPQDSAAFDAAKARRFEGPGK